MTEPRLRNFLPMLVAVAFLAALVSPARELRRGERPRDPLAPATPTPTAVPATPTPTPTLTPTPGCPGRGDVNDGGQVEVTDVFYLINFLFAQGTPPPVPCKGDVNGDGMTDVLDVFYLINALFAGGPPPPP